MNENMLNGLDEEEEQLVAIAIALATSGKKNQTNVINAERDSFWRVSSPISPATVTGRSFCYVL